MTITLHVHMKLAINHEEMFDKILSLNVPITNDLSIVMNKRKTEEVVNDHSYYCSNGWDVRPNFERI